MPVLGNAAIRAAFEQSNIAPSDYQHQATVLEGLLREVRLPESAVLAVSQTEVSLKADGTSMGTAPMLLVVFPTGIAVAQPKFFGKRLEVQSFSHSRTSAVRAEEKMYATGRGEMAIQGMIADSVPRFRLGWNWSWSGPARAEDAAAERNRILDAIQRAMRGDPPTSVTGTERSNSSLISQKQHLVDWARRLFREAGVPPTPEKVESVARLAATGLFVSRVVAFADARPLPSLRQYCSNLPGELDDRFDQFDEIYAAWIRLATEESAHTRDPSDPEYARIRQLLTGVINDVIDTCLAESEDSFRDGIRADYA